MDISRLRSGVRKPVHVFINLEVNSPGSIRIWYSHIRPNKKISVFRVTGLKILGRVGTDNLNYLFSGKKYNFMHFERQNCLSKCINFFSWFHQLI